MSRFSELSGEADWDNLMEERPQEPDYYPEQEIPYPSQEFDDGKDDYICHQRREK